MVVTVVAANLLEITNMFNKKKRRIWTYVIILQHDMRPTLVIDDAVLIAAAATATAVNVE